MSSRVNGCQSINQAGTPVAQTNRVMVLHHKILLLLPIPISNTNLIQARSCGLDMALMFLF